MGQVMLPQGPRVHCDNPEPHDKHTNHHPDFPYAWCDGVPVLEPFIELTVRVPLRNFYADEKPNHVTVLHLLAEEGPGIILDEIGVDNVATLLRVRTGDGVDRVYPLVRHNNGLVGLANDIDAN